MLELRLENTVNDKNKIGDALIFSVVSSYKGKESALSSSIFFSLMTAFESAIRAAKKADNEDLLHRLKLYTHHDVIPTLFATFSASLDQKALIVAIDDKNRDNFKEAVLQRLCDEFGIMQADFSEYWAVNGGLRIRSETTQQMRDITIFSTYFVCEEHRNVCESLGWLMA